MKQQIERIENGYGFFWGGIFSQWFDTYDCVANCGYCSTTAFCHYCQSQS